MTHRNPKNPDIDRSFADSWPSTNMTADRLAAIRLEYHMYSHTICGLSLEEVLRTGKMDVTLANCKVEVMVVYETQLSCGLRMPSSTFLQLCEGCGACPGQLPPNTFIVINAFCVACHLMNEMPIPEIFS